MNYIWNEHWTHFKIVVVNTCISKFIQPSECMHN